jgi:hypothetical protein
LGFGYSAIHRPFDITFSHESIFQRARAGSPGLIILVESPAWNHAHPLPALQSRKPIGKVSTQRSRPSLVRSASLCVFFINAKENIVCVKTGAVPLLGVYSKKVQPLDLAPDSLVSPEPTR